MKNILLIAGTRPNFIKLAPLYHRLKNDLKNVQSYICHTGQHFDFNMSDIFWQNLNLPEPDFQLNVKGNGVVDTIGKTLLGINDVLKQQPFDLVIVFGDVNATASGAIAAAQSGIPVMHVEAGLRSFDRSMPEEINRIITDHVSNYLMVSEQSGIDNLQREGFATEKYLLAGNIMIECLLNTKKHWEKIVFSGQLETVLPEHPVIATFHRPENVDDAGNLKKVVDILIKLAQKHPVVFPVHPRTKHQLVQTGLMQALQEVTNILITEPLSYFEFLKFISQSAFVITDSGGVQEETSFLNIPCITFRKNTERPVTIESGTNILMSIHEEDFFEKIIRHCDSVQTKKGCTIPCWDDKVSERIVGFVKHKFNLD